MNNPTQFCRIAVSLLCALFMISLQVYAGGVMLYEISSADTRLASAGWSSRAQDPSTVFTNPAGMSRLCGEQVQFGAQPIYNYIQFDPNSRTNVSGQHGHANKWLPSGSFFYVRPLDESFTFGIGSLGYFGSDLHYNNHWVGRYYVQDVLMMGFSLVPALSYRINDCLSIGVGANVMYGIMKQRSAVNNILDQAPDGYFNLKDNKVSAGGVFGVLYEMTPSTRFGVQYLTSVKLGFRDRPKFSNIGPILTGILDEVGILNSTLNLKIRVPQSVIVSAYHDLAYNWSMMADIGWQQWSRFERTEIVLADLAQTSFQFTVKYRDSWHAALGTEWHVDDCWTLSSGIAYDSAAVSTSERTFTFPVGRQWRLGAGARWMKSCNLIFDFSTALLWQGDLNATQTRGALARTVSGKYKNMYTAFACLNLTWLF